MRSFDFIKQLLLDAVKDPDFVRKNTTMQDLVMAGNLQLRVQSLTADYNVALDYTDVINETGALGVDQVNRSISFSPSAAGFIVSSFREGVIDTPGKLWSRGAPGLPTPSDGIRYLCADTTRGIVEIGELLDVVGVYPGFAATATQAPTYHYAAPTATLAFTVGGVEYLAVAMGAPWHIINIYTYSTGAGLSSIGTLSVANVPPLGFSNPVAMAFNPTSNMLYVACTTGQPGTAITSTGFIASVNLSVPATPGTPTLLYNYCTRTDGSLLHGEVSGPKALEFDAFTTSLWVVNGNDEIGSIKLATGMLSGFIPTKASTYALNGVTDIKIKQTVSDRTLYIANSSYGNVISYDLQRKRLLHVYGLRSVEDTVLSQDLLFFGNSGSVNGVLPDSVLLDGDTEYTDVILISDATNKRMQRLDETAYTLANSVVFDTISLPVPILVTGWSIVGDVSSEMVQLEYRTSMTDPWHQLSQEGVIAATQLLQFRAQVKILPNQPVRAMSIKKILIVAEQA